MKIVIVSATISEIKPFLNRMNVEFDDNSNLIEISYKQNQITILITGIGMVSTTYFLAKNDLTQFDWAINIGICGSFNKNMEIGSVVNVYEDCFSELGAEDGDSFLTLEQMELKGTQKITNKNNFTNKQIDLLPKVNAITVNTVHGNEISIAKVFNLFHPYVESMEGAAFMFVCEQENIPYVQIRAVSNYVEKRNKDNWNIPLAIENLNKKLVEIINEPINQ